MNQLVLDTLNTFEGVFFEGFFEIDIVDIGQRGEPREDIGELFEQIGSLGLGRLFVRGVVLQCGGKFTKFFDEPEESAGSTTGRVCGVVTVTDEMLKSVKG